MQRRQLLADTFQSTPVNTKASSEEILNTWASLINSILIQIDESHLAGIAIAMPGPFDYPNGICLIKGLDKYDGCYGLQAIESLKSGLSFLIIFR